MFQDRAHALLTGELTESVGFIRNAVQHLGNIVDGLLRLSRAGRVEYKQQTIAEILASLHSSLTASGARVHVAALPQIQGDRNAVAQVFANLIGNAIKSVDPSRPGVIEISASSDEPPVFAIRDNGIGIPDEYRGKIFQVFQHVHADQRRGEGMGLAIVRRIVERHEGRIWFESAKGAGTTFFFTLAPDAAAAARLLERSDR